MKRSAVLPLSIPRPPPDRGPLIDARQIQAMIGGTKPPSTDWINRHAPNRCDFGYRTKRWYRDDVVTWLETLRNQGAA